MPHFKNKSAKTVTNVNILMLLSLDGWSPISEENVITKKIADKNLKLNFLFFLQNHLCTNCIILSSIKTFIFTATLSYCFTDFLFFYFFFPEQ